VKKANATIASVDCVPTPKRILEVLKEAVTVTCDGLQVKLANKIQVAGLGPHVEAFRCFAVTDGPFAYSRCIIQKSGTRARKKKGSNFGQFAAAVLFRKSTIFLLLITGVKVVS
jgi:hypothetical protein